jgi:hypothetical protein
MRNTIPPTITNPPTKPPIDPAASADEYVTATNIVVGCGDWGADCAPLTEEAAFMTTVVKVVNTRVLTAAVGDDCIAGTVMYTGYPPPVG